MLMLHLVGPVPSLVVFTEMVRPPSKCMPSVGLVGRSGNIFGVPNVWAGRRGGYVVTLFPLFWSIASTVSVPWDGSSSGGQGTPQAMSVVLLPLFTDILMNTPKFVRVYSVRSFSTSSSMLVLP